VSKQQKLVNQSTVNQSTVNQSTVNQSINCCANHCHSSAE
jgi:hypothetical protein